jgi:hypothetical protein
MVRIVPLTVVCIVYINLVIQKLAIVHMAVNMDGMVYIAKKIFVSIYNKIYTAKNIC